jgi:hypothetical protein
MPGNRSYITSHRGFLTSYDVKTGIEMFEVQYRWMLKLLAKLVNVWILPVLSTRCFHQWGGAKMMLREVNAWMKPGDFVYKTDVYSYYASINHSILIQQLNVLKFPYRHVSTIIDYCERTVLRIVSSIHCNVGIPKGSSISPVLGALYLTPLDHAMERWMTRGDCFYARFQDDIILVSRKRHVLKRMRTEMFQILRELQLCLRFEKTFKVNMYKKFLQTFSLIGNLALGLGATSSVTAADAPTIGEVTKARHAVVRHYYRSDMDQPNLQDSCEQCGTRGPVFPPWAGGTYTYVCPYNAALDKARAAKPKTGLDTTVG